MKTEARRKHMNIVILDAATLGTDTDLSPLQELGTVTVWNNTAPEQVAERIEAADVIVSNKVKLTGDVLCSGKQLKLICLSATGYDCVDTLWCAQNGIGVCNVPGYSTHSVAQLTVAMVLELVNHLSVYWEYVHSGAYSRSGVANALSPVWHELYGKTWGIVGGGNIGRQVAKIAEAFGCRVLICRRKPDEIYETADLNTLCAQADIISVHVPLTEETRGMIGEKQIALMKESAIVINVARGAVTDEMALAEAVRSGRIAGLGVDVYSQEPFDGKHPFNSIMQLPNVCLTPHTAWGAIETRNRCIAMVAENISAFCAGQRRNRVEL
jgi:glycerate dehydrogenase